MTTRKPKNVIKIDSLISDLAKPMENFDPNSDITPKLLNANSREILALQVAFVNARAAYRKATWNYIHYFERIIKKTENI